LFLALGYNIEIKWFRTRNTFEWKNITVTIDFTRGYGYIIEFEQISDEANKETALVYLREKFSELGIELTAKSVFDERFQFYKENWRELI
jgi:adenylate cyclase class IV